jgi:hypothetical protein
MSSRFHEVLPLIGFENLTQSQACQQTIHGDPNSIPYPLLNENTFVISSSMVLNHGTDREHPRLQFRVGWVLLPACLVSGTRVWGRLYWVAMLSCTLTHVALAAEHVVISLQCIVCTRLPVLPRCSQVPHGLYKSGQQHGCSQDTQTVQRSETCCRKVGQ